jgi:predicted nucleic acid-binding protein
MRYVIDASVAVKWYVPEIFEAESTRMLESDAELHAPELIVPEFGNIIWKKVRANEITQKDGAKMVAALGRSRLVLHSHALFTGSAFSGAVITGQTVYDWTYLSLAVALSCEFVTADRRFYDAIASTKLKKNLIWIGDFK